ncbi:hypothetical protein MrNuV_ORF022 [Macrobrachium rosenbergii nudivirus]|nr:hypothetical protein MrNuV_ORF022 [Macrobrachium rosenbergii nudivirus]
MKDLKKFQLIFFLNRILSWVRVSIMLQATLYSKLMSINFICPYTATLHLESNIFNISTFIVANASLTSFISLIGRLEATNFIWNIQLAILSFGILKSVLSALFFVLCIPPWKVGSNRQVLTLTFACAVWNNPT